jgi:tRNA threonylcarbamoyladenosine biosynthesis protein TsaE
MKNGHREENATLEDINLLAKTLVEKLALKRKNTATIVFFDGDLGAGKTTFVQSVAKILGVSEKVISPTFILKKIYDTSHPTFKKLVHIDAYRFNEPQEARVLRLEEDIKDAETLIMIEWPEKMSYVSHDAEVSLEVLDETTRAITISYED